jgi:hypothetical protein
MVVTANLVVNKTLLSFIAGEQAFEGALVIINIFLGD